MPQPVNQRKNIIATVAACFLFLALLNGWPYGFFTLLRFAVCFSATYVAWLSYESQYEKWAWILGIMAVLFNPFIPIHFARDTWRLIDLIAGIFWIALIFSLKLKDQNDGMKEKMR